MAITLADFTKIWASTSPLTPYSFSESNYKEGWNFIGGTPPSRQMWDSIQKNNDEKLKYIVDNFLPLSGGTMTGDITLDGSAIVGNPLTLTADDGNGNTISLVGNSNGSITWNGKELERVNASGSNYIRYESGLQICWGAYVTTQSGGAWTTITFPVAFKSGTTPATNINSSSGASHYYAVNSLDNTSFKTEGAGNPVHYISVGYWK